MSWRKSMLEALGNIGDFIGGLAVIATLLYLAIQIRQNSRQIELNTRAVKAAAYTAQLDANVLANLEIIRDPTLASWLIISRGDLEQLTPPDRVRFDLLIMTSLRLNQNAFVQAQEGLIRPDLLASHEAGLRGLLVSNPGARALWSRNKSQFAPDFVKHVDSMLAHADSRSSAV